MKNNTKTPLLITIITLVCIALIGCESKKTDATDTSTNETAAAATTEKTNETAAATTTAEKVSKGNFIEVTREGAKIDPPVAVDKIPDGAYYCDMGTVHYARMEKGDSKCALCGMMLKHKGSDEKGADGGHEGHEH
jgi:cytoskeletal protein RodZ